MADAANPNGLLGPNENYAQRVPLTRADQSTIAQAGGFYGGSGGNTVDRNAIPKTLDVLDKNSSAAKPLGQSHGSGY